MSGEGSGASSVQLVGGKGQCCLAEADLLVLWGHFVPEKGLALVIGGHWIVRNLSLPLTGPRGIVQKVSHVFPQTC